MLIYHNETKLCLWCEKPIVREFRSKLKFDQIKTHKECMVSYSHYKCAKSNITEIPERVCPCCSKILIRRENEPLQAWNKRTFCNKSCAATGNTSNKKPTKEIVANEEKRFNIKHYVKGTKEFEELAALYQY